MEAPKMEVTDVQIDALVVQLEGAEEAFLIERDLPGKGPERNPEDLRAVRRSMVRDWLAHITRGTPFPNDPQSSPAQSPDPAP